MRGCLDLRPRRGVPPVPASRLMVRSMARSTLRWTGLLTVLVASLGCPPAPPRGAATARPIYRPVRLVRDAAGAWSLERAGRPFALRGAGGHERLAELAALGASSLRTWGVDEDTGALLDEAEALGLGVTLGLWLGHVEDGFDWHDPTALAAQRERVRAAVLAHRDHPALLLWGVGNEVELGNDDPAMWRELGALVRMVRALDPQHPAMVVTAELGEANAARLREFVPELEIWGINSYGGVASLSERLDTVGWEGPFIVTELGSPGDWESARTSWGAPVEPSSAEKVAAYSRALASAAADPRCLGAYAFVWGRGARPADTWYALLGPGHVRYAPVDALAEAWGAPPSDRAPRVSLVNDASGASTDAGTADLVDASPLAGALVEPGAPLALRMEARDPEGAALRYAWVLHRDSAAGSGASPSERCREFAADAALSFRAPSAPGPWRLLGVAVDPAGHAGYASARFLVSAATEDASSREGALVAPFYVDGPFVPSGWMGDANARVRMDECAPREGFCHGACRHFHYAGAPPGSTDDAQGWAGVVWLYPEGNWHGARPGVRVPAGARAVEFVAWGAAGGERVSFSVGSWEVDGFSKKLENLALEAEPQVYRIPLDAGVRDAVVYGFAWSAADPGARGFSFSVADIRWLGADDEVLR